MKTSENARRGDRLNGKLICTWHKCYTDRGWRIFIGFADGTIGEFASRGGKGSK